MKKKQTRQITETVTYCDECSLVVKSYDYMCCHACGAEIHKRCGIEDYCQDCWEIGKPFRKSIEGLESLINLTVDLWHDRARRNSRIESDAVEV